MRCLPRFWSDVAIAGVRCGVSSDGVAGLSGGPICICSVATSFPSGPRVGSDARVAEDVAISSTFTDCPCTAKAGGGL